MKVYDPLSYLSLCPKVIYDHMTVPEIKSITIAIAFLFSQISIHPKPSYRISLAINFERGGAPK